MSGSNFRRWQPNPHLVVLIGYFLLTAVMTWPLVRNLTTAIPGDSFDGWQNYWNQWWIKVALVDRQQTPFFADILYHPTGVGLYFHTLNPFNGLTTLPIQLAAGLIPAYNAVVFLSWTLGGYGAYLLARWVLGASVAFRASQPATATSHLAPFLAGLIFSFSPFHMAHLLGHMQVMALQWIPFYTLYLLRSLAQQQQGQPWRRSALLAGLFLALTGLCDWYFVLYLFFLTGLVVVGQWVRLAWERRPAFKMIRSLLPPLVAGTLFLLLLAPILVPMVREAIQFRFMVRPATDLYILSASVMDFLIPNRLHALFRPDSFAWPGNQIAPVSERTIGIGYVALGLALVAAWRDRRRAGFWLVAALCFVLLALGPRLHLGNITAAEIPDTPVVVERWTPYALLNQLVPFMRISRSVSRYALMVQLCIAVAAAVGLASLGKRSPRRHEDTKDHEERFVDLRAFVPWWWRFFGALACLVLLAEYWVAPYPLSPPDTPAFYEQLRSMPDAGAVLNLPMNYDRPGYLLYQTVHQKPLTVAYISRDDPRTLTERVPVLQHFRHLGPDILAGDPAAVAPTVLHDLGVGIVILDRYKMPGGLEREYTEGLAAAIFAGQPPLFADERITVYRVQAPVQPVPYLSLGPLHWGALQATASEHPCRLIGEQPAQVELHHAPPAATLRIEYRTIPEHEIYVRTPDGTILATLPAAPEGNQALVELGDFTVSTLSTVGVDGACIEALELRS